MMTATELIQQTESILLTQEHTTLDKANAIQLHNALSTAAMQALAPTWVKCEEARAGKRQAYYLSCEFLMGRMVYNNLYCLGLLEEARTLLAQRGVDLATLEDIEDDAFGNGGLGRLAACFLDSAVTHNVPSPATACATAMACSSRALWMAASTRSRTTGRSSAIPGASAAWIRPWWCP